MALRALRIRIGIDTNCSIRTWLTQPLRAIHICLTSRLPNSDRRLAATVVECKNALSYRLNPIGAAGRKHVK